MDLLVLLAMLVVAGAVAWGAVLRVDAERHRDIASTINAWRNPHGPDRPPNPSAPERH